MNNNTPAFPSHGSMGEISNEGMSLRDYFAAKAMQAVIQAANDTFLNNARIAGLAASIGAFDDEIRLTAVAAYRMADMMLAEREKEVDNA